jgi:hypothetical protein
MSLKSDFFLAEHWKKFDQIGRNLANIFEVNFDDLKILNVVGENLFAMMIEISLT